MREVVRSRGGFAAFSNAIPGHSADEKNEENMVGCVEFSEQVYHVFAPSIASYSSAHPTNCVHERRLAPADAKGVSGERSYWHR